MLHNTLYLRQDDGRWPNCGMESSGCSINTGYGWGSCLGCSVGKQSPTPAWSVLIALLCRTYHFSYMVPFHVQFFTGYLHWQFLKPSSKSSFMIFVCFRIIHTGYIYINIVQSHFPFRQSGSFEPWISWKAKGKRGAYQDTWQKNLWLTMLVWVCGSCLFLCQPLSHSLPLSVSEWMSNVNICFRNELMKSFA